MNSTTQTSPLIGVPRSRLSLRPRAGNANHHLWNNNGSWWCHFTVRHANHIVERRRISLRTRQLTEARRRRDTLFQRLNAVLLANH